MCNFTNQREDYMNASSPYNDTLGLSWEGTSLNSSLCINDSLTLNSSSIQENRALSEPEKEPFIFILDIVFTIGFTFIVIFGTSGNAIVLWIVIGHRQMWNSTNYFLVNLSIADLLMAVANTLFNFIYMRDKHWPFGSIYCTFNNFMSYVTVAASVLTLIAITLDRYRAIIYPLRPKLSRLFLLCSILAIWIASSLLALPSLLYSKVLSNGKVSACILLWPDGLPFNSTQDYVFNIVFFVLTYLLPMVMMGGCYARMGKHLWGTPIIGEETPQLLKNYQNKKKVVKMFLIIVVVFGVCWLPYHAYFIYYYHDKSIVKMKYISHIFLGFYWFAMANTMVNPIIYYWMNTRFRKYFIRVLMFLPRVVCGKNLGKDWECQKTNNTMQLKQMNGVSNFNSHVSNSPDVLGGAGSSGRRISHTGLARSRSMTYSPSENHKRDVTCQNNYGNSLLPQRQSRLTSSCESRASVQMNAPLWDTTSHENENEYFKQQTCAKPSQSKRLWSMLKGNMNKFNKKSRTKLNNSSLFLPEGCLDADVFKTNKVDSICGNTIVVPDNSNNFSNIVKNGKDTNKLKVTYDILPATQIEDIPGATLSPKEGNTNNAFQTASVTVHANLAKCDRAENKQPFKTECGDITSMSLKTNGNVNFQNMDSETEDRQRMTVAGGHKISAKKVSVNTISVTFTDEIDAFGNVMSDQACGKHGDRTAVIDLLHVSGSLQCNKEKNTMDNNVMHLPEYTTKIGSDPNFQKENKCFPTMKNGVIANQDFQVIPSIKHNCNRYSENSINNDPTPETKERTLAANHQKTLDHLRNDSKNSLTLNHNYQEEKGGEKGIELNVYRYNGWKNSLSFNGSEVTKSTLV